MFPNQLKCINFTKHLKQMNSFKRLPMEQNMWSKLLKEEIPFSCNHWWSTTININN